MKDKPITKLTPEQLEAVKTAITLRILGDLFHKIKKGDSKQTRDRLANEGIEIVASYLESPNPK